MKNNREYRNMTPLEVRAEESDEMVVEGFATTFNEPYILFENKYLIYPYQI